MLDLLTEKLTTKNKQTTKAKQTTKTQITQQSNKTKLEKKRKRWKDIITRRKKNPYRNQSALGQGLQWHCTPTASEHTQLL